MDIPETCLNDYIGSPTGDLRLVITDESQPQALENLARQTFSSAAIETCSKEAVSDEFGVTVDEDSVLLISDGKIKSVAPLREMSETLFLTNSDQYVTSDFGIEGQIPKFIRELDDITFRVSGYPKSLKQKLPLISISRHIEYLSSEYGGEHHASFQKLSRISSEYGTRKVYDLLAESQADVHAYGYADHDPEKLPDISLHGGEGPNYEKTWFVVHKSSQKCAALVAIETFENNRFVGQLTHDEEEVNEILEIIKELQ